MTNIDFEQLEAYRNKLLTHPIYQEISTPERVKVFMKHHVFAVWDFMSLLKRLQKSVTNVDVPWFPAQNSNFARFINEIVLGEESDIDGKGGYSSHFGLYLEAMEECGADVQLIQTFIAHLQEGLHYTEALEKTDGLNQQTKDFINFNLDLALNGEIYEVAAAFFYGREGLIPEMFQPLIDSLKESGASSERLNFYLNRHIEVDEDHHGPLAEKLLIELCGNDQEKLKRSMEIGEKCFESRAKLWDGILDEMKASNL
ncbi:DUF3050 domain-containing protein [Bacillus sp. B15-48]|uniref:DUF3050 domain-containing protein n=1 Tax=Bacillus sp. B15-48 TaxID=1548601 RepID=UPI00193FEE1A|nr:DUF3050 domain-containing protein [Bacillus sp. B15-48]MBM4764784.1 DUF3050 domain-containing protein [Bacillus sp. B15-48]